MRQAREYVGFSQDEVAKKLNVPRTAISLIESGQRRVEALELRTLAGLYQRSVASLTGEEQPPALPEDIAHLARTAAKLTETDRMELRRFAEFLNSRSPAADQK
ncbi:MAG TPA: helix-turn-helix transcriptional regulator [Alloacidobacterium sp.]|nr:helix-turn-helix transcriptional regulator [Alloacidobacterium sp.]